MSTQIPGTAAERSSLAGMLAIVSTFVVGMLIVLMMLADGWL